MGTIHADLAREAYAKNWGSVSLLLAQGASYKAKFKGVTVVQLLSRHDQWKLMCLLPAKAFLEDVSQSNKLLHHIVGTNSQAPEMQQLWEHILGLGLNWNVRNQQWDTPLHAYFGGRMDAGFIEPMLARGANPALKDRHGHTPLDKAIRQYSDQVFLETLPYFLGLKMPYTLQRRKIPSATLQTLSAAKRLLKARQSSRITPDSEPRTTIITLNLV